MKTRTTLLIGSLLLILFAPYSAAAVEPAGSLLEKGNEAYSRKAYDEAIDLYNQIITQYGFSAPVLYNIANSYAQKGEVGSAILHYKRAAVLAPSDSDIRGNLEKVRKESGLFQQEPVGADRIFKFLTINQWAITGLLGLSVLAFFSLATTRTQFAKATNYTIYITCLLLIFGSGAGVLIRYHEMNPSVVISKDAKIRISPFDSASSIGSIREGRLTYPQKSHGKYIFVEDEIGRKGWIAKQAVESVY